MLKSYINYGSIATKTRAMYGKRLTESEWSYLREASTTAEVAGILRKAKGWLVASSRIPAGSSDTGIFISAIRYQVRQERERLIKYALGIDRQYLSFYIQEEEYRQILAAFRQLKYNAPLGLAEPFGLGKKSRIDFSALVSARDFGELVGATRGSMYYPVLSALLGASGSELPDYAALAAILENTYYSGLYNFAMKKYSGAERLKQKELIGTKADIFNILSILRILRHFPDSVKEIYAVIFPVHWRLNKRILASLFAAGSEENAVEILKNSHWAEAFSDYDPERLDRLFDKTLEDLNRKILRSAAPGIATVTAYLALKAAEGERLVRVVNAVHYGIPPATVL